MMTDYKKEKRTEFVKRAHSQMAAMLSLTTFGILLLTVVYHGRSLFPKDEDRQLSDTGLPPPAPAAVIAPGVEKPFVSLGTGGGMVGNRSVVEEAVRTWLSIGGSGLDTAIDYKNDDLVGAALEGSGILRERVFLTTKQPGPIGFHETVEALRDSLVRLRTTYVDLYLIHFPDLPDPKNQSGKELRQETWKGMEEVLKRGWTKSIGVSNYKISDLEDTLEIAQVPPALNQVLWNPATHDDGLLVFCQANGIALEAWSPLGGHDSRHGEVLKLPTMQRIAESHGVSTAQVALKWTLQHGMTLATGTTWEEHMRTDLDVFGFRLTDEEVASISDIQNQSETMLNLGSSWNAAIEEMR